MKNQCPGCDCASLPEPWVIPKQPVILNYRFDSAKEAREMPRRDMHLIECPQCGLIFNASLDEAAIPYDENYDNRQGFSTAFVSHLNQTANHLVKNYPIKNGTVMEVGCGKGDFLKLLCLLADSQGTGFDTTCEIEGSSDTNTTFYKRNATECDVRSKVNALICRHVIEHINAIGDFFKFLHAIALAGKVDVTYVETPLWERIAEQGAFWDIFYEHCNYFKFSTLRKLAERAGFAVLDHRLVFGGQYQAIYLGLGGSTSTITGPETGSPSDLISFKLSYEASMTALISRLKPHLGKGKWAIWGAGAKGVTLANQLGDLTPSAVVDSNPGKWGKIIPGTTIPTVAPRMDNLADIQLFLIANPIYKPEISHTLSNLKLSPYLLSV